LAKSKSVGCSSDIWVLQEHFTRVRHVCHILIGDPVECLDRARGARRVPRNLPLEDSTKPIEVLQAWALEEYAAIIAPRLRAVEAREPEPKVMPKVLEAWGIPPVKKAKTRKRRSAAKTLAPADQDNR
jgi:hypothetical protein